jgi:hypothetical protein
LSGDTINVVPDKRSGYIRFVVTFPHLPGRKGKAFVRQIMGHHLAFFLHHNKWPDAQIDHIDRNRANNAIANLREASQSQNLANAGKRFRKKGCHSRYKGVSFRNDSSKWVAYIGVDKKLIHLGQFDSELEAAVAYNESALVHFGPFAALNSVA